MLNEYAKKRRFGVTPEPGPEEAVAGEGPLTFVIQKHAASTLHYDLRLELDGVLISWAVPKGPSLNPTERHLAVKVEDHPLSYGGFEGMIPQGEYGGGEVIVWDRGTYTTDKAGLSHTEQVNELRRQVESGKLEVVFEGEKLHGGWVIIHTREKQWLLIKRKDEFASETDVLAEDRSVISGCRIGGVPDPEHPRAAGAATSHASDAKKLPDLRPMLLSEATAPFSNENWSFELKLDGIRILAYLEGDEVRIFTRNGHEVASRFPSLVKQLKALKFNGTLLDGEVVLFDEKGLPNFQALVQPFQAGRVDVADFCVFDILFLDGQDLRKKPWSERREQLEGLNLSQTNIKVLDVFREEGKLLYEQATEMGFEGVVGKKIDSRYEAGIRSNNWVKLKKYHSEEFVVGGYTKGDGARSTSFGALAIGRPTDKGLEYVGNVGGGFSDGQLDDLFERLTELAAKTSPFAEPLPIKHVQWVNPQLVVEVRFTGWTREKRLRFPIFLRVRPDVSPASTADAATLKEPVTVKDSEDEPIKKPEVNRAPSSEVDEVLAALNAEENELRFEVEGHKLHFSSLSKEMWPGVTKRDLVRYYATVSEALLRYLRDRPLSFVRCPEGIDGERFFQKHWDKGRPAFVEVVSIHSDTNSGARDYVVCNNLATLLTLGQMATLELNPWNSRATAEKGAPESETDFSTSRESLEESVLNRPDYLVLDLDPHFGGKATGWKRAEWDRLVEVAFTLRDLLKGVNLKCFTKSSGKSGLHLFVPMAPEYTYDQIRAAAGELGRQVIQRLGAKATIEWNVKKRPNGVFIDVNQNVRGKTMAAVYSPRAAASPGVSMPLLWDELLTVDPTQFTVLNAPQRLARLGDLWAETIGLDQKF